METIVKIGAFVNEHIVTAQHSQEMIKIGLTLAVVGISGLLIAGVVKVTQKH